MEGTVAVALSRARQIWLLAVCSWEPWSLGTVDYLPKITQLAMPKEPGAPSPYTTGSSEPTKEWVAVLLRAESP